MTPGAHYIASSPGHPGGEEKEGLVYTLYAHAPSFLVKMSIKSSQPCARKRFIDEVHSTEIHVTAKLKSANLVCAGWLIPSRDTHTTLFKAQQVYCTWGPHACIVLALILRSSVKTRYVKY